MRREAGAEQLDLLRAAPHLPPVTTALQLPPSLFLLSRCFPTSSDPSLPTLNNAGQPRVGVGGQGAAACRQPKAGARQRQGEPAATCSEMEHAPHCFDRLPTCLHGANRFPMPSWDPAALPSLPAHHALLLFARLCRTMSWCGWAPSSTRPAAARPRPPRPPCLHPAAPPASRRRRRWAAMCSLPLRSCVQHAAAHLCALTSSATGF